VTDSELYAKMTGRQRVVAALLISGTVRDIDIARAMGVTDRYIRKPITALFDLTGMDNKTELALFIVRRPGLEKLLVEGGPAYVRSRRK
jgi:DNA-binding NarL/FixJ family response regulator